MPRKVRKNPEPEERQDRFHWNEEDIQIVEEAPPREGPYEIVDVEGASPFTEDDEE